MYKNERKRKKAYGNARNRIKCIKADKNKKTTTGVAPVVGQGFMKAREQENKKLPPENKKTSPENKKLPPELLQWWVRVS